MRFDSDECIEIHLVEGGYELLHPGGASLVFFVRNLDSHRFGMSSVNPFSNRIHSLIKSLLGECIENTSSEENVIVIHLSQTVSFFQGLSEDVPLEGDSFHFQQVFYLVNAKSGDDPSYGGMQKKPVRGSVPWEHPGYSNLKGLYQTRTPKSKRLPFCSATDAMTLLWDPLLPSDGAATEGPHSLEWDLDLE